MFACKGNQTSSPRRRPRAFKKTPQSFDVHYPFYHHEQHSRGRRNYPWHSAHSRYVAFSSLRWLVCNISSGTSDSPMGLPKDDILFYSILCLEFMFFLYRIHSLILYKYSWATAQLKAKSKYLAYPCQYSYMVSQLLNWTVKLYVFMFNYCHHFRLHIISNPPSLALGRVYWPSPRSRHCNLGKHFEELIVKLWKCYQL